jgi:predicted nicotinamide N-methyase
MFTHTRASAPLSASSSSSSSFFSSRFCCCCWQKRKTLLPFVLPPPELPQKKNGLVMNQSNGRRLPFLVVARGWRDDSPMAPREGAKTKKKKKKKNFETGKKGSAASASFKTIDLGRGKTVEIFCDAEAENVGDVDFAGSAEEGISLAQLNSNLYGAGDAEEGISLAELNGNLYGAGDVIWPSSEALARLVAHVPSLVKNKDCIDIGAGLGLVSAAAIMSQAKRVLAVDYDAEVLEMTRKSVEKMASSVSSSDSANSIDFNGAEVKQLDWTCVDGDKWPKHEFDVALASDVLYDENCAQCVANVIDRVLKKKTDNGDDESNITALLCDPAHRPNREKFSEMCDKLGLEAIDAEYPGDKNMRLVQVLRR